MNSCSACQTHEILICNQKTFENVKRRVHQLTLFLREISFLTEAYILDYFVEDLWTQLPLSWREIVKDFEAHDLEAFLNPEEKIRYQQPWPLSFLSFRASAFALALSRKSIKSPGSIGTFLDENFVSRNEKNDAAKFSEKTVWGHSEKEFEDKSGQHKSIPEFCRRHVKPKKQHEIFRMAQLTVAVMDFFGIKHVIDIGSGQGHLSRLLALCYNLNVASIEAKQCHVSGAESFDKQAFSRMNKLKNSHELKKEKAAEGIVSHVLPHHLEGSMTVASSKQYLEKIFRKAWAQDSCDTHEESFALLGLHTCGDLAATLLKMFAEYPTSKILLSVGCCYMKLNSDLNKSYPLSTYLKSLPHHHLSYEARELACHAIEMYIKRLQENVPSLKIHCYRATLEKCIVHHFPNLKHLGLRGVKHAEFLDFSEYAEKALSKVSCPIPKDFFLSPEIQSCLQMWKNVLIFYSLRLITAPVVESLILLDRMLYLFEKGYPSCIAPIFDPTVSPRNHVLISAISDNIKS